jgi:hypothetical protein
MPLNLRRIVVAASISGALLLVTACASSNGSNPAASATTSSAAPAVAVTVTVSGSVTVTLGSTAQYAATVTGSTNPTVSWTVNQVAGGNAQLGTISTAGLYTAPATMPSSPAVTIAAISVADPTVSNSISVSLQAPAPAPVAPPAPSPATATAAARFLDQTSFGPTAETIAHVQQIGLQAALTEQFNQSPTTFGEPPSPDAECPTGNIHCTPEGDRMGQRPATPARGHGSERDLGRPHRRPR